MSLANETETARRSWGTLLAAWALVLVPLAWGVLATAKKAWLLFSP
jgi:hypothetical protein